MNLASFKKSAKIMGLAFLVVILLSATIFLGRGTTTLFSRASSCDVTNVSHAQVSANSSVITWTSNDVNQASVHYGTNASNLNLTAPEGSPGKNHNVPLTLLTPNTVYYYLISVGKNKCDSSGQTCSDGNCIPWSFTTAAVTPQPQIVAPILSPTPASPSATPATSSGSLSSTGSATLSSFCQQVKVNLGAGSGDATKWAVLKQYDMDGNGFLNGLDVMKCQKSGR